MEYLFAISWYIVGYVSGIAYLKKQEGEVTVLDLLHLIVFAFSGIIMTLSLLGVLMEQHNPLRKKVL